MAATTAIMASIRFGLISLPCTGPALALSVSLIPAKGNVIGGGLMLSYGPGHCMLILVAGTSMAAARSLIESKGAQRAANILNKIAAVLIVLAGVYFEIWRA